MKIRSLFIKSILLTSILSALLLAGCQPNPRSNVVGYMLAEQSGIFAPYERNTPNAPTGSIRGRVLNNGVGIANATVVVAERSGVPHVAQTDQNGIYQINNIPNGQYVPAALAPGFQEEALHSRLGIPTLLTIEPDTITTAPDILLTHKQPVILPNPLAPSVNLTTTATYSATAPFPAGSVAHVQAFAFDYNGATIDTLRLYTPQVKNSSPAPTDSERADYPVLFMVYPTPVDGWETVSVAFSAQGYAVVAISPAAARLLDIEAHAIDAIVGLTLAQSGALGPNISDQPAVALGGSFSSAVLNRVIQNLASVDGPALTNSGSVEYGGEGFYDNPSNSDSTSQIAAWITVGGIGNAFDGTADFHAGSITVPIGYEYAIPALGPPHISPLTYLRYSPIYAAAQFPPTLIIHTDADTIIPIQQAFDFENALRAQEVPVDVFYYQDVSHYLQIDENLTDAGAEMFYRILDYVDRFSR